MNLSGWLKVAKQRPEGLFGLFRFGVCFVLGRGGGGVWRRGPELKKGAFICGGTVGKPWAIGFSAVVARGLVIVSAVFTRMDVAAATGAELVFELGVYGQGKTAIVTTPHIRFPSQSR